MGKQMFWIIIFGVIAVLILKQMLLSLNTFEQVVKCLQMAQGKHLSNAKPN